MYEPMKPLLTSNSAVKRYEKNPVLSSKDVPYPSDLTFNAGVAKWQDKYIMIFRNDFDYVSGSLFRGCNLGIAFSQDGMKWEVCEKPFFSLDRIKDPEVTRVYDPRLTVIGNQLFVCFAMDTHHGIRGGIGKIRPDFSGMDIISLSAPDNRNMVLFPEKINGMYVRLERPFTVYSRGGKDRFDIWISKSPDLKFWGESTLLLGVENVPYSNDKIGPAAPPIKTPKGWLTLFHAVDIDTTRGKHGWEDKWQKRYTAGIMLLDLEDPSKVIGMSKQPLLAPEASYEALEGFRASVIFPGGFLQEDDGSIKIYYGAADTVECLATAKIEDLIALCTEAK
ncbi:glycoside hydrolase family 130 protein [Ructibacterium gallinarum]|nr:glycoside hydrolase family 130 protein [Ructibacterium gallinarum]